MPAPDASELIAALERTFGEHPGCRPAHAKGIACTGTFTGGAGGARICRAAHLRPRSTVDVVARFSNGSGHPDAPDWLRDRRGLAVRFGADADLVAITHPIYFACVPGDLVDFSRMRLRDFLAKHPNAAAAIAIGQRSPLPASYATVAYHAVHAFGLVDARRTRHWARLHWEPHARAAPLSPAAARDRLGVDYLREDLADRLRAAPVRFTLQFELARPGDPTDDPTALWDGERERVPAGVLELHRLAPDLDPAFDPTHVPDGIELPDDAVLHARGEAYRASAARRCGAVATRSRGTSCPPP